jgi:hypothetical protein
VAVAVDSLITPEILKPDRYQLNQHTPTEMGDPIIYLNNRSILTVINHLAR